MLIITYSMNCPACWSTYTHGLYSTIIWEPSIHIWWPESTVSLILWDPCICPCPLLHTCIGWISKHHDCHSSGLKLIYLLCCVWRFPHSVCFLQILPGLEISSYFLLVPNKLMSQILGSNLHLIVFLYHQLYEYVSSFCLSRMLSCSGS